uniref:Uncharacterized protein n=1 Tax=Candidatus Kentrum sp. LPFa TaxID=2126335 RepID=A0A450W4H7_9GAMM|nr:MAG: hypothetical protein BECKLPF1236B_GA0070989_102723 [Candidatus Kentron sp. LPFa]
MQISQNLYFLVTVQLFCQIAPKGYFISRSALQMEQVLQNTNFALPIPSHALSVRGEVSLEVERFPYIGNQCLQYPIFHIIASYLHIDTPEILILRLRDFRRPIPFLSCHGSASLFHTDGRPISSESDFRRGICRDPMSNRAILEIRGITRVFDESFYQGAKRDGKDAQGHQYLD